MVAEKISFLEFEKALENQEEVDHFTTITWTYIPMEIKKILSLPDAKRAIDFLRLSNLRIWSAFPPIH